MGSKYRLLPHLERTFAEIGGQTAVDAFSGSGVVSYLLKAQGFEVVSNDFLNFPHIITRATVANSSVRLEPDLIDEICGPPADDRDFIRRTFDGLYFDAADRAFLDLGAVEMQEEQARPVTRLPLRGFDLKDRLAVPRQLAPEAERLQQPLRGQRQCIGAAVEIIGFAGIGRPGIDHGNREARTGQCQRKGRAVQPATGNENVEIRFHGKGSSTVGRGCKCGAWSAAPLGLQDRGQRAWIIGIKQVNAKLALDLRVRDTF